MSHKATNHNNSAGFTIVELMIATAIFSVILLLCATAIIQVGRMFYKGSIVNRTQDMARTVVDDVTQAIQFGPVADNFRRVSPSAVSYPYGSGNVSVSAICLGGVRYSYNLDRSLGSDTTNQLTHVLWKDRVALDAVCTPQDLRQAVPSAGGQELLGSDMRLPYFNIPATSGSGIWNISLTVSYGSDGSLFVSGSNFSRCIGTNVGGQYCASSTINTHVTKRV